MNRFLICCTFILFAGCESRTALDQSSLCFFASDKEAQACKDGQLAFFRPDTWGNEQLPLIVAATYCDFRHPVVQNNSGVVCVFSAARLHLVK